MYSEDGITMSSVDFGLIPLKTIFDNKINCNINIKHTHENKIDNNLIDFFNLIKHDGS